MALRALAACLVLVPSLLLVSSSPAADAKPNELVQRIMTLLGNDDREFRAAALEQIRTSARGQASTQLFAAQLPKLDAGGQIALLAALADRGDAAALPAILTLLTSAQDEAVRAAALSALGKLGGLGELGILVKALAASSDVEKAAAKQALVELAGEKMNGDIAKASESGSPEVRAVLIDVLATRRAGDQAPTLLAAIVDEDGQVRSSAMSALGQIGRPEHIAKMLPGVLKAEKGGERDAAERNVAAVCGRIPDESQRGDALIAALNSIDKAQRDELLSLLGRVGGPKLIDFVAAIATGNDPARRRLGIDALGKWPNASVADKLMEIATTAQDRSERAQAFQAFVKVCAIRDDRPDNQRLERMKQAMKVAASPEEVTTVLMRTRNAYDIEALRFVLPYVDQPKFAQMACETIVEIAHHREVRDPNKAEVDKMLDKVIATSKDEVVVDRANRYKKGQTWTRPSRR